MRIGTLECHLFGQLDRAEESQDCTTDASMVVNGKVVVGCKDSLRHEPRQKMEYRLRHRRACGIRGRAAGPETSTRWSKGDRTTRWRMDTVASMLAVR